MGVLVVVKQAEGITTESDEQLLLKVLAILIRYF